MRVQDAGEPHMSDSRQSSAEVNLRVCQGRVSAVGPRRQSQGPILQSDYDAVYAPRWAAHDAIGAPARPDTESVQNKFRGPRYRGSASDGEGAAGNCQLPTAQVPAWLRSMAQELAGTMQCKLKDGRAGYGSRLSWVEGQPLTIRGVSHWRSGSRVNSVRLGAASALMGAIAWILVS